MLATALVTHDEDHSTHDTGRLPRQASADALDARFRIGHVEMFEPKEHIYREGDAVTNIYMVEAGNAFIYRTLADGRRQVIDFAYPGDLIGLGAIGEHADSAQVTTRTRVRSIPMGSLRQAARADGQLGLKLCEALSRELLASRELLFTIGRCTASERLASFLITLSRRNERCGQDPMEFVLPMTRYDIADFLGLTIETVSRTFTKLRRDGIIDLAQSVIVTILDHEKLSDLAEGRSEEVRCVATRLADSLHHGRMKAA